jgi:hypothetical protein
VIRHAWLLVAVAGCTPATVSLPERKPAEAVVEYGTEFKPISTGTIRGRVVIDGRPSANALVWLEMVDLKRSKSWPVKRPVCISLGEAGFAGPLAEIARLGDSVEFRTTLSKPTVIRGRGAMDIALPLPSRETVGQRRADRRGIVAFASGGLQPMAKKFLLIAGNPYATVTGPDGSFELTQVPNGQVLRRIWAFNDRIIGHDRDPESGLISRYRYAEPWTDAKAVSVVSGEVFDAGVTFPP